MLLYWKCFSFKKIIISSCRTQFFENLFLGQYLQNPCHGKKTVSFFCGNYIPASTVLHKKCPYSELFWSTFSCIGTKYGEKLQYLVRMQENANQNNSEYGHFLRSSSFLFPIRNLFLPAEAILILTKTKFPPSAISFCLWESFLWNKSIL